MMVYGATNIPWNRIYLEQASFRLRHIAQCNLRSSACLDGGGATDRWCNQPVHIIFHFNLITFT